MGELLLPRPDNVRGRYGTFVTGDMYNIAHRLQELDKALYIQSLDPPARLEDKVFNFAIVEIDAKGDDSLVFRCESLDARVIDEVRFIMHVPFEQRFAEAERREAKHKADADEAAMDKLVEEVGLPMRRQLERCGFTGPRPESLPKAGRTAQRARFAWMPKEARPEYAR